MPRHWRTLYNRVPLPTWLGLMAACVVALLIWLPILYGINAWLGP